MKRPEQHETDTIAQRIFNSNIPPAWVARRQDPDYGIDYDVEIFENQSPTGIIFSVQLKGTRSPEYSQDVIKFSFETDKLIYYCDRVKKPVFLVLVDVSEENAYWLFTQQYARERLDPTNPKWRQQKTVTLEVPVANHFIDSPDAFKEIVKKSVEYIYLLQFKQPHWQMLAQVQGFYNPPKALEDAIKRERNMQFEMEYHLALLYYDDKEKEKAIKTYYKLKEKALIDGNFDHSIQAALGLVHALNYLDLEENRRAYELLKDALDNSQTASRRMLYIGTGQLFFLDFVYYFTKTYDLNLLSTIAQQGQMGVDYILGLFLKKHEHQYFASLEKLVNLITTSIENGEVVATCVLAVNLADMQLFAYPYVRYNMGEEKAGVLLNAADDYLEFAYHIAKIIESTELQCFVLQSKANLLSCRGGDYISVLDQIIELSKNNQLNHFEKAANNLKISLSERKKIIKPTTERELSDEEEHEMFVYLAKKAGVDFSNEKDPITQIINIGLKDRNPERILKHCEHLWISIGSYGIPAEMIGLPTAGSKFLYCDITGYCIYGMQLDVLLESLKGQKCKNCAHHKPRPQDWKWSRKWQQEVGDRLPKDFKESIKSFFRH